MNYFKKYILALTIALLLISFTPNYCQDSGVSVQIVMKPIKKIYTAPAVVAGVPIEPQIPLFLVSKYPAIDIKYVDNQYNHKPKLLLEQN